MAKKEEEPKITLDRTYNVPLRKGWLKAPKYKRAKKAVKTLKEFMVRHMKSDDIKIGLYANKEIWKRGIKSPPHHINVTAKKNDKDEVFVEIVGAPVEKKVDEKVAKKEAAKKSLKKDSKQAETEIKKELSDLEKKTAEAVVKKDTKPEEKSDKK
ncbi:MAG: 50S ribosomal protein L31e [Candidatus Woesearchaeota archaeon]|jgi:large subunit ribosomal protein L31e|nr:50S ribosomal protein L31e [Candidatus Woesearchaeota archaeon]MDP7457234.1 50S ribosomal protein L31e [Candidatus Woesearchaeota archaeon]|tara:strand:- start:322 stop:786 length:465 start_codon:yes stop_codon:yes gene_type:complete